MGKEVFIVAFKNKRHLKIKDLSKLGHLFLWPLEDLAQHFFLSLVDGVLRMGQCIEGVINQARGCWPRPSISRDCLYGRHSGLPVTARICKAQNYACSSDRWPIAHGKRQIFFLMRVGWVVRIGEVVCYSAK